MIAYATKIKNAGQPKTQLWAVQEKDEERLNRGDPWVSKKSNLMQLKNMSSRKVAAPPATPRHTMFPLWLLPSGSDQVHG
ncbi:hypothetical protein PS3A_42330 [Pseudomonas sp. 3A(2025)]